LTVIRRHKVGITTKFNRAITNALKKSKTYSFHFLTKNGVI